MKGLRIENTKFSALKMDHNNDAYRTRAVIRLNLAEGVDLTQKDTQNQTEKKSVCFQGEKMA